MSAGIHPTAIVHETARLGHGVTIGPYTVIEGDTEIGDGTRIAAHVAVKRYTRLGRDNQVDEGAVLGGEPQDLKFSDCASFVEIGDGNRIREGVTIHRGNHEGGVTRLGHGCYLMAYCHVAHDCRVGDRVVIANNTVFGGQVEIADGAFISGLVAIHQFCRVGRLAMVAGCARVIQDCLPFITTEGQPARARTLNLVGLKRAGMPQEEITALKRALRLLRSDLSLDRQLQEMAKLDSASVAELSAFVTSSPRGFSHFR